MAESRFGTTLAKFSSEWRKASTMMKRRRSSCEPQILCWRQRSTWLSKAGMCFGDALVQTIQSHHLHPLIMFPSATSAEVGLLILRNCMIGGWNGHRSLS